MSLPFNESIFVEQLLFEKIKFGCAEMISKKMSPQLVINYEVDDPLSVRSLIEAR
jgi:hypothetical protein